MPRPIPLLRRAAWPALVLLLASCSLTPSRLSDEQDQLARNRRLWRQQGVDDYRFTLRRNCFCPQEITAPVLVEVRDGQVVSRTYRSSGQPVDPRQQSGWPEVEGLFRTIQRGIDTDAVTVRATYHPQLGYPTEIFIDQEANVADEEMGYRASDLTPLR